MGPKRRPALRRVQVRHINPKPKSKPKAPPPPFKPIKAARPFNGDPHCARYIENLLQKFQVRQAIETGTYQGGTTLWLGEKLGTVHTIENNAAFFKCARPTFAGKAAIITTHLGNSPVVMKKLLDTIDGSKRTLFYLDAHWGEYWPLNDELLQISHSAAKNNCLIVIDDFQIPDRADISFDRYKNQPLNMAFVEERLKQAIPDLQYEYYVPPASHLKSRGRLVAYPKQWVSPIA